ncbi:HIRAN domain-containing protein [Novosphingobium sp. SL115]|uniref:HIRAN domain-containing protein n=1 Tax=Novosphingobium sp. SL115 TaxID=2995150 RepID=UPI002276129F|nr:HIRAN domain-containing protein [Novosphingobium sp. SL115]MCY1671728.1 HIRAN domain-containing protein [Novosphingobium sp. SL115]
MGFWQGLLAGLAGKPIEHEEPQARNRMRAPRSNLVAEPPDVRQDALPGTYRVGLVDEQQYQSAVKSLCVGELVKLLSEPDNPNDKRAIVAVTFLGRTLGYVPKSNWLYTAINFEGHGATAKVMLVEEGQNGFHSVVLEVALTKDRIGRRRFTR